MIKISFPTTTVEQISRQISQQEFLLFSVVLLYLSHFLYPYLKLFISLLARHCRHTTSRFTIPTDLGIGGLRATKRWFEFIIEVFSFYLCSIHFPLSPKVAFANGGTLSSPESNEDHTLDSRFEGSWILPVTSGYLVRAFNGIQREVIARLATFPASKITQRDIHRHGYPSMSICVGRYTSELMIARN